MKKNIMSALMVMGAVIPSSASDFGIGLSVKANDYAIYVPFKASDRIHLEGVVRYAHQNEHQDPDPNGVNSDPFNFSDSWATAGVGVFWLQPVGGNGRAYLGPRLSYFRNENSGHTSNNSVSNKRDGYGIAPTIGYEYFPVKNVSLAGEVGVEFTRFNQSFSRNGIKEVTGRGSSSGTTSALILRVYF